MSSKQKETQTSTNDPWSKQSPFLTQGFDAASNALAQAGGAAKPDGFVSQMTPQQIATFQQMLGYGQQGFGNTQATGAAGASLVDAGAAGATGALTSLGGFAPGNQTDSIIGDATKFADNPAISGMVDAAMRDSNRNAQEVVLPGIEMNAAGTGNINSSRRAISEGIVQRGLAEKAGDISSTLRGAMYDKGLDLASGNANFNTGASLDAMKAAGALGTGMVGQGVDAQGKAVATQGGLFDIANAGGQGLQQEKQLTFDEQMARYGFDTQSPFDALNNYWNIVGSQNWGGQQTGTKTSSPSIWQTIGGMMSATGNLVGGFTGGK